MIGIKRERGETPSELFKTLGGDFFRLNIDGSFSPDKPVYKATEYEGGVNINIVGRGMDDIRSILKGVVKKYPKADINDFLKDAKVESNYLEEPLEVDLEFGGLDVGKSIVKSTLAMVVDAGVDYSFCEKAMEYLCFDGEPCFGYYYNESKDVVINRDSNLIFHGLAVEGDPDSGMILGYVEYFSCYRIVVCLSDKYSGNKFYNSYFVNPISGDSLDLKFKFDFSNSDIKDIFEYNKIDNDCKLSAFGKVIEYTVKRSNEREMDKVVSSAFEYIHEYFGVGDGETLSEEYVDSALKIFIEKIKPYIDYKIGIKNL